MRGTRNVRVFPNPDVEKARPPYQREFDYRWDGKKWSQYCVCHTDVPWATCDRRFQEAQA